MHSRTRRPSGFSLVEVTLAIGIIALTILSTVGLLGVGLGMNRDSVAQTGAASVVREIVADLQMLSDWSSPSPRLQITPASGSDTPEMFFVTYNGEFIPASETTAQQRIDASYRVDVRFAPNGATSPPTLHMVVSWPTGMAGNDTWPAPGSSIYEVVASLKSF
jgi:uncharacterized protein (TIGR02598 family)